MMSNRDKYSEELCGDIKGYYESYADEIGYREFSGQYLNAQLGNKLAKYVFQEVSSFLTEAGSIKVLDVGSGLGGVVSEFRKNNINCIGVEPDKSAIEIAKKRLFEEGLDCENVFYCSEGESLPFDSNLFDLVCSVTVLEHVRDIDEYLNEAYRVMRPGGIIFIIAPNYFSFWEGHYRIYTPPYMMYLSKVLFKAYSKLFGRNPRYADTLDFRINPVYLEKLLGKKGFIGIKDLSLNRLRMLFDNPNRLVDDKMRERVAKIRSNFLLKAGGEAAISIMGILKIYHPIVLFAKKPVK